MAFVRFQVGAQSWCPKERCVNQAIELSHVATSVNQLYDPSNANINDTCLVVDKLDVLNVSLAFLTASAFERGISPECSLPGHWTRCSNYPTNSAELAFLPRAIRSTAGLCIDNVNHSNGLNFIADLHRRARELDVSSTVDELWVADDVGEDDCYDFDCALIRYTLNKVTYKKLELHILSASTVGRDITATFDALSKGCLALAHVALSYTLMVNSVVNILERHGAPHGMKGIDFSNCVSASETQQD
ncbi:hypothetical protein PRIPAC_94448 [Pristionchus pacificus]|uniref:Uncharacterized protein n=1 Tax=Pristionchus pacificus TaxID=54126 RepID=A0A2A6BIJ0_PRIPA|nr:hypothetical protein PRIPAC_94448 [Pristionchus pacificus]|eukprot:PDM65646.1 hypothetical protein PRIPAC_45560 [Pristionchus pacificus]